MRASFTPSHAAALVAGMVRQPPPPQLQALMNSVAVGFRLHPCTPAPQINKLPLVLGDLAKPEILRKPETARTLEEHGVRAHGSNLNRICFRGI
jgi:hypothetical protein